MSTSIAAEVEPFLMTSSGIGLPRSFSLWIRATSQLRDVANARRMDVLPEPLFPTKTVTLLLPWFKGANGRISCSKRPMLRKVSCLIAKSLLSLLNYNA